MFRWMFAALLAAVVWSPAHAGAGELNGAPPASLDEAINRVLSASASHKSGGDTLADAESVVRQVGESPNAPVASGLKRAPKVTLEEAISRALDASPAHKSRREALAGAEAGVRQSGVLPNPAVNMEFENFAGTDRFADIDQSELTLGLTQRIERTGKRQGRIAVAEAERDAAALERERSHLDVVFDAKKAFVELFAAQATFDNAGARLKTAAEIEAMAEKRVHAARDPVTVKLNAEIETAEARTALEQAGHDLHNAKRTLALLWGEPDAEFEIDAAALLAPPPNKRDFTQAAPPDVKARELAARRAALKVELEEANARSDISLGLGVRRFENGGDLAGVLSLSVPLAIFDDNQGNIDRAAAERRAADLDVAEARRRFLAALIVLEEEAARSQSEYDTIRRELLPRADKALAAARRGYDAGAFGYRDIADAQRKLNELTAREIAALRLLHIARASLDRLSGRIENAPSDQGTKQ
jgi:outer membrane protein, heavy metal efflux system